MTDNKSLSGDEHSEKFSRQANTDYSRGKIDRAEAENQREEQREAQQQQDERKK